MSNVRGNMEAQLGVLYKRVQELQDENKSLLSEVERLKTEIQSSTQEHEEKLNVLKNEKTQLLRESEVLVDSAFASIHNTMTELSSRMDTVQITLSRDSVQRVPVPPTESVVSCLADDTPLLPSEIVQCNAEMQSARESLLLAIKSDADAKTRVSEEEAKLGELLRTVIPDATEVSVKISKVKQEVETNETVSSPTFNAMKEAMLVAKQRASELTDIKMHLKKLQLHHSAIHQSYNFFLLLKIRTIFAFLLVAILRMI
jgi:chromosome segregation ATPase